MLALLLALSIGPLQTSGERQVAQLVSDGTVGTAVALDVWSAWQAQDRKAALLCVAGKDLLIEGTGLAGQHWITSPRPDGTGNGMPSLHALWSAGTILSAQHPWLNATLSGVTMLGRYLGARHTPKQLVVGGLLGVGYSFIHCGG